MILASLLLAIASPAPVRAEPVEAPLVARAESGPSTSSGRTEEGAGSALPTNGNGSALDAERAFAADAQTLGQWTAFRKWAASDATMFVPQPVNAQAWLKDRTDPAKAIAWWPTASYVSCDGSLAVNTGGWTRPDGAVGYFSTVWQRQQDGGWKWIVDSGDALAQPRPRIDRIAVERASCDPVRAFLRNHTHVGPDGVVPLPEGRGYANDASLTWHWSVEGDGARSLIVSIAGRKSPVINDKIAPPK